MSKKRVLIMGAAGRDFHNFNTYFRNNKDYEVVAFTATQIPDIAGRKYPAALAGKLYPKGIPIYDEKELHQADREAQGRPGGLRLFRRALCLRHGQGALWSTPPGPIS